MKAGRSFRRLQTAHTAPYPTALDPSADSFFRN